MALITHPRDVAAAAGRLTGRMAGRIARRVLPSTTSVDAELRAVPDDLPRDSVFAQPLVADTTVVGDPEQLPDGEHRVTFRVLVRDAEGRRCPDIHVEARVTGPDRSAVGETTTDMLGAARFRMAGRAGEYRIEVLEVAALGLAWDRVASTVEATTTA